jgi:hypothetical protein
MAKLVINIGAVANDGTGDPIREAMSKVNSNFTEVYDALDILGDPTAPEWGDIVDKPTFSTVATTGAYSDLSGKPSLGTVSSLDGFAVPAGGTTGQVLVKTSGTDGATEWDDQSGGGGGIADIVSDTTPQLGGNLDLNGFTVGAATAADLTKLNALTATSTELNHVDGVTSAIQTQLDAKIAASLFDANTILAATTDNTPIAVTVAEQTLVGRITAGNITALTAAQTRTLLNVEDGATNDQTGAEIITAVNATGGIVLASITGLDSDVAGALYQTALIDELALSPGESMGPVNVGGTAFDVVTFGTAAFTDILPSGAPTTASSSGGAITLDYTGIDTIQTTTTQNITTITFTGITAYQTVRWIVKHTTARNITFPAGTIMKGNAQLLLWTGVANSFNDVAIYNDNGTYVVTIGDEGLVGA